MEKIVEAFLEVIKYSVPAVVVYFLISQYGRQHYQLDRERERRKTRKQTWEIQLKAYERIALLVERISIGPLLMRLGVGINDSTELRNTLLLGIQQEYEHNITQQIYISDELWQMILLLRERTIQIIDEAHEENMPIEKYKERLLKLHISIDDTIGRGVKAGIKEEVKLLIRA